jgi:hypothetical protein
LLRIGPGDEQSYFRYMLGKGSARSASPRCDDPLPRFFTQTDPPLSWGTVCISLGYFLTFQGLLFWYGRGSFAGADSYGFKVYVLAHIV